MTTQQLLEVAIALLLIGAGIWLYRRSPGADGRKDTQGAVLLLIVGAIVLIHGLGLMGYSTSWGGRLGL